jgi:hypothetical protein
MSGWIRTSDTTLGDLWPASDIVQTGDNAVKIHGRAGGGTHCGTRDDWFGRGIASFSGPGHRVGVDPATTKPSSSFAPPGLRTRPIPRGLGLAVASNLAGLLAGKSCWKADRLSAACSPSTSPNAHPSAAQSSLDLPCGFRTEEPAGASPQAACASGTTDTTTQHPGCRRQPGQPHVFPCS